MSLLGQSANTVRAFVLGIVLAIFRPSYPDPVWVWAEREVYLDDKMSPGRPGEYRSDPNPFTRTVQEFFTDPDWDELVCKKSSQVGITEAVLNVIRFAVAEKPTSTLYANASQKEVKRIARIRLKPTIGKFVPVGLGQEASEGDLQTLTYFLPHMTLYLAGGGTPSDFSNKPLGLGIIDDVDDLPEPPAGKTSAADQLRERFKTVDGSKLYLIGRPTTDKGLTAKEYETGTQEKHYVPCPHCDRFQELVWSNVRFDHCKDLVGEYDMARVLTETYYECENIECPVKRIEESHKYAMNLRGEWRITNPKHKPRKRSIHISDIYSPFAKWGELAVEFLEANGPNGSLAKLQHFNNSRLGLEFKQQRAEVTEADVKACRGAYRRGSAPWQPDVIVLGSDLQGDGPKWVKLAFRWPGECAVIDYGMTLALDDLMDVAAEPVNIPNAEPMIVKIGGVDEGFKTTEVRDFVMRSEGLFYALKGRAGVQVKRTVAESPTEHKGEEMIVYHFDDYDFKKQLYVSRISKRKQIIDGKSRTPLLWIPEDSDPKFLKEFTAEKLVELKGPRGYSEWKWEKKGANDWPDGVKMGLVIWEVICPNFDPANQPG